MPQAAITGAVLPFAYCTDELSLTTSWQVQHGSLGRRSRRGGGALPNVQGTSEQSAVAAIGHSHPISPPRVLHEEAYQPEKVSRLHAQGDGAHKDRVIKLSILMPAYNEARTVAQAIEEILRVDYPCEMELIVVDDGSTDGTWLILAQVNDARVIIHRHQINKGKGAALLSAASLATGTHILPFDADLEYIPEDIPRLLEPVLRGRCNVVYGARLFGFNTVYHSHLYAVGNHWLTRMANILFNVHLSDLHTCLKLMPLINLRELNLSESGFGLDTEVTARLLRRGVRPFEIPVSYYGRSHAEGKKITWRDAVACARILLRVRIWNPSHAIRVTAYAQPESSDELARPWTGNRA